MPGRPSPTGWRELPMWPRSLTLPSEAGPRPRRCGSSSVGSSSRLGPNWPCLPPQLSRLHHRPRRRHPGPGGRPPPPRRDRECHRGPEVRRGTNHLPSGRFPANAAWLAVQVMAHNLGRWTARIGLGEQVVTTKTLRRRFFSLAGRLTRKARGLTLHLPQGWPWQNQFCAALAKLRAVPLPF